MHNQGRPLFNIVEPALSLSATFPPSLHSALQDRLAEGVVSSHVPEPLQLASLDCGE